MATDAVPQQNEARQALADVADVERARAERMRTPKWYWHVSGGVLLLVETAIALPIAWQIAVVILAAIGGGIGIGAYQARTGFRPTGLDREGVTLAALVLVTVVVIGGACLLIGVPHGWRWMAPVSGVLTYAAVVGFGEFFDRLARR